MKKIIFILTLVLALGAGSVLVLAADNNEEISMFNWHNERMNNRTEGLQNALESGNITQDEYNTWSDHYNYMEEFHKENGFQRGNGRGPGMGYGFGGCHGGRF